MLSYHNSSDYFLLLVPSFLRTQIIERQAPYWGTLALSVIYGWKPFYQMRI
jgi:hypothetical protein